MKLQLNLDYHQVLELVRQMSPYYKAMLFKELQMELSKAQEAQADIIPLQQLLLDNSWEESHADDLSDFKDNLDQFYF